MLQTALNNKNYNNEYDKNKITNQYVRLHTNCLNEHDEVEAIISGGRLFHCAIVLI